MDIINEMIEAKDKEPVSATQTDPNQIVENLAAEAQEGADKKETETPEDKKIKEEADQKAALDKEAREKKETDALKEREKAENKDIQKDDKGNPITDEAGDKVKKNQVVEKDWWEKDEAPASGTPENKTKDEVREKEITSKLTELAEIKKILADPEIEAFIAAKKTGKNIKEFYNEVVGTDYDSLSPEALNEIDLKRHGIEGDELTEANDAFAALPNWEKRKQTNGIKAQLKSAQEQNLKKFSVDATAQQEAQQKAAQKTMQEADSFAKQLIGQKKFGIEITPDIAHGYKQAVMTGMIEDFQNKDGSMNHSNFADMVILYQNRKAIVEANVQKALNKGKGEVLADVTRASKNDTVNRVPDEKGSAKTDFDRASDDFYGQYAKK